MIGKHWMMAAAGIALSASMFLWNKGCETQPEEAYLEPFESCDDLETYLEDMAVEELTYVDPGLPSTPTLWFLLFGCASQDMSLGDDDGGNDYSSTNLQEFNVDEADFVKNDGDFLYIVHGQFLRIVAIWPPVQMHEVSRVPIQGYPIASYLDGDTMAVLSFLDGELDGVDGIDPLMTGSVTKVTLLDVADREAPRITREVFVEGKLQDSRRIEDQLYLVLYRDLYDLDVDFGGGKAEVEERIQALTLDDWLPHRADKKNIGDAFDISVRRTCECTEMYRPNHGQHVGFTSVVAVDLVDPDSEPKGTSLVADSGDVYASEESLYLAVPESTMGHRAVPAGMQGTRLHKFDLDGGSAGQPVWTASARVPGTIASTFSMDEAKDTFRIATTWWTGPETATQGLFILREEEGVLQEVAALEDFAGDEEIYSARFFDDRVYLVTFPARENVNTPDYSWELDNLFDPLWTIDLRDAEDPRIMGELEISGYSKYLHPMDQDRLLAVGEEVDPDTGQVLGLQVSLFDITDFDEPALQDRVVIETGWDASAALSDHHAFNYYEPLDLLAIPVLEMFDAWSPVEGSYLEVFHVTPEEGILRHGRMDASPLIAPELSDGEFAPYCSQLRRSIVINDVLYGVGAGGVIAADYDTPGQTIATHHFPDHGLCNQPWEQMDIIW